MKIRKYKTNLKEVNRMIKKADFVVAKEDKDKIIIGRVKKQTLRLKKNLMAIKKLFSNKIKH